MKGRRTWLLLLLVAAAAILLVVLPVSDLVRSVLGWIRASGAWGWVVYALLYIVLTVLLVPGSVMTLAAGWIWGVVAGTVIVSGASTAGAVGAFLAGRYLARESVESWLAGRERFERLDRAVRDRGFRIVLLTRLSPLFPFVYLNYAFGLTSVRLGPYLLASWIGMLPGTVMYVYLGSLLTTLSGTAGAEASTDPAARVYWWVGLAVTLLVTWYLTRLARAALRKEIGDPAAGSSARS